MVANASIVAEQWPGGVEGHHTVKSFQQIISLQFFDIIIIVSPSHDDMDFVKINSI